MKPEIKIVERTSENGSCNYCQRGTLRKDRFGLDYPYDKIILVTGTHVRTNFCLDCWESLKNFVPTE